MERPFFANNHIYHIYNRGVEKRKIFLKKSDYYRFIHSLFEFNDKDPVLNVAYRFNPTSMEVEPQYIEKERKLDYSTLKQSYDSIMENLKKMQA